jgi:hypothetical protein
MFDQPIVERKSSSPLATSLLVLSAVCLLTASVFVGARIKAQSYAGVEKPTESATAWYNAGPKKTLSKIDNLLKDKE